MCWCHEAVWLPGSLISYKLIDALQDLPHPFRNMIYGQVGIRVDPKRFILVFGLDSFRPGQ